MAKVAQSSDVKEKELRRQIKERQFEKVYFFYGVENYLTSFYTYEISKKILDSDDFVDFNLHKFDGQDSKIGDIITAVEALPFMSEKKGVIVRDFDVAGADNDLFLEMLADLPDYCVLIFWHDLLTIDSRKKAKWNKFIKAVDKAGVSIEFGRKSSTEISKMLVSGAKRRGATLSPANAKLIQDRCGNSLFILLGELDKFCAVAHGGEITREIIEEIGIQNLEASVFELSKAILAKNKTKVFDVLHSLFSIREDPVAILAVLSGSYVDLYRAKIAQNGGIYPPALAEDFPGAYKGREFKLKNAQRDCAKLDVDTIVLSLEILASADESLKSTSIDKSLILEKTVTELIILLEKSR